MPLFTVRRLVAVVALAVAVASPVLAQRATRRPDPVTTPASMLADQFMLLALSSLSGEGEVREDQLIRARILLDLATRSDADSPDLWRMRAELARLEKDRDARAAALREYVRRMPGDDAAQLELLLLGMADLQTLDQRIAAAAAVLDSPTSEQLSPAVQSRLASFIASSYHELGNDDQFGMRLAQALRLDPSNIAAARMAYELAVAKQRTPADIAQALLHLVKANPADVATRVRFGQALLECGLGADAVSQFEAAAALARAPMDIGFYRDWAAALILADRPQQAAAVLDQVEAVYQRMAEQPVAEGQPVPDGKLPLELQVLRLVLAAEPEASAAPAAMAEPFDAVYERLKAAADTGDLDSAARLVMLCLVCQRRMDTVEPYFEKVAAAHGPQDPRVQVMQAWRHFRAGDAKAATPLLVEAAAGDPWGAYLVVLLGDVKDARRQAVLQQTVQRDPDALVGLLAMRTLVRAGGTFEPARAEARIAAQMDRWPGYLRTPNMAVQPWLSLQLTIDPPRYGYLEPIVARITLRNRTDMPLSIADPAGPAALPRNLLMLITLRQTGGEVPAIPPVVVDLGRRIRIDPLDAIEVTQRLDHTTLGGLLAGLPSQQVAFSVVAVYDAVPGSDPAQGRTGVLGVIDKVTMVQVAGEPVNDQTVDAALAELSEAGTAGRRRALARLTLIASRLPEEGDAQPMAQRIAERMAEGFADLPAEDQAWVARFVGGDETALKRLKPIHDVLSQSERAPVRIMYLANQARRPDGELLSEAMKVRDPDVISFARALQVGLRAAPAEADAQP